jgi:hypothetical protein
MGLGRKNSSHCLPSEVGTMHYCFTAASANLRRIKPGELSRHDQKHSLPLDDGQCSKRPMEPVQVLNARIGARRQVV